MLQFEPTPKFSLRCPLLANRYYHGSPDWGLSELRSQAELGVPGVHMSGEGNVRGGWRGIFLTPHRLEADLYAGDGGAVYEVKLSAKHPLVISGYNGRVSDRVYRQCLELGIDCILTPNFMGWAIALDPRRVQIVATFPSQFDELNSLLEQQARTFGNGVTQ